MSAAYYAANGPSVGFVVGLFSVNAVLLAIAGAGAHSSLRALERPGESWSMIGLIGILFIGLIFAAVAACQLALVIVPNEIVWTLHNAFFAINPVGLAVAMFGLSMGGLRTGLFAKWHAYLGLAGAALSLLAAALAPLAASAEGPWVSYVGFLAFGIWMLFLLAPGTRLPAPARVAEPALT